MKLDLQTITLALLVSSLTLTTAVMVVASARRSHDSLFWWGIGLLLHTLSYGTFLLRYADWIATSVVLTNLLTAGTIACHTQAVSQFDKRTLPRALLWGPVGLAGALALGLATMHAERNVAGALLFGAQCILMIHVAARPHPVFPMERGRMLVIGGTTLAVLLFLVRIAVVVRSDSGNPTTTVSDAIQSGTYLFALMAIILNTIGYVTMQKERAEAVLRHDATHDPLTGLFNRRALLEVLEAEWSRARRSGEPLAALMLDIDFFKNVNDALGHQAGDLVLREVAQRIDARLRTHDTAGRYGGEEFFVLLPATDDHGALAVAESLRRAFEEPIRLGGERAAISITVSIGVHSRVPGRDDPQFDQMIAAADRALYRAKRGGRNRCEVEA